MERFIIKKTYEEQGIILKINKMYFEQVNNSAKPPDLGIKIFLKNYIIYKDNPRLREAVYVHIEHLIGEKSFANDIAYIEIGQLETNQVNLTELYQLKQYIDNH